METINNKKLLDWYCNPKEIDKDMVEKLYDMFMKAYHEDTQLFIKISLYIAGTRTKFTETHFKVLLHFLATNYPEKLMSNLKLFVEFGHISILTYLLQEDVIKNRIKTFIKYHASFVTKYKEYVNDETPTYKHKKYFKYKLKNNDLDRLIKKIQIEKEFFNVL